jgi:hypothetical protein
MYRKVAFIGVAVVIAFSAAISLADDVLLTQLYGNGVHAYNGGDYFTAHKELTAAIQGGTIDPRVYYFRGLADLRMGRSQEAAADFQKGAEMETGDSNDVFPVSLSLARVQGPDREMLERFREAARITAHQRQEAARQARYQQRVDAEKTVLRHVEPTDLNPTPGSTDQSPSAATSGKSDDPFAEPKAVPSQKAAGPKPEEAPKSNDPFGAAAPKAQPAAAAPAAGEKPKAAGEKPKETAKPAAAPDADPFGGASTPPKAAPAAAKPQTPPASKPAEKPAAESKPATQPAPTDDNPFK